MKIAFAHYSAEHIERMRDIMTTAQLPLGSSRHITSRLDMLHAFLSSQVDSQNALTRRTCRDVT